MICKISESCDDVIISRSLCGNFIELGYGRQVECMQSEMLFNRRFAHFTPYNAISRDWYDLNKTEDGKITGYEKDWSVFDWYHSAYEHNSWYAAPAVSPSKKICDENTYIVNKTPFRDFSIDIKDEHGEHYLLADNKDCRDSALAQDGKYVSAGETYIFTASMRIRGSDAVYVSLSREGDFTEFICCEKISNIGAEFGKYSVRLKSDFTGYATFCVWLYGKSSADIAEMSLKSAKEEHGFREGIAEFIKKELAPSVIRWPGGCFSSFYDFRDGIGDKRCTTPSYFWGGINENDIGSLELGHFCEACGAEQMICVNLFHPKKQSYDCYFSETNCAKHGYDFPMFTDINKGAELAAQWVEYMNAPPDRGMGKLRAAHGRAKPFGVKYWEMDNEAYRWFSAEQYAQACVIYSRKMKEIDPSVKIGMLTYGNYEEKDETLIKMLEIAGSDIDFLADRGASYENLDRKLSIMRGYNKKYNRDIKYCNTEWLPYDMFFFKVDNYNKIEGNKSYMFTKWRYAMNVFRQMMMWQREGQDILFINFNNLANTHGQNAVDTPRDSIFLSACGQALAMMAKSPAFHLLNIDGYSPSLTAPIQYQAAYDKDKKRIIIYACNVSNEASDVVFKLPERAGQYTKREVTIMSAPDINSMNKQNRGEISTTKFNDSGNYAEFEYQSPPLSFSQIIIGG